MASTGSLNASIVAAFATFSVTLAFHILLWRWRRPKHNALALLGIFFGLGIFLILALYGLGWIVSTYNLTAALLLYGSLASAYIQTYPAIEDVSPSLFIFPLAAQAGHQGIALEDLLKKLDIQFLIEERIDDLFAGGLIEESRGQLRLNRRGFVMAWLFWRYRALLGLPPGKG